MSSIEFATNPNVSDTESTTVESPVEIRAGTELAEFVAELPLKALGRDYLFGNKCSGSGKGCWAW